MQRREFLTQVALTPALAAKAVTFGLIADVHHGLMPDAQKRLEAFLGEAQRRNPNFIIQLGDFCHPRPESREFLRMWHSFRAAKHNVLGNHDMDFGDKARIMGLWEMPRNYYSFDHGGFHFVILDCNYLNLPEGFKDFANGNYFGTGNRRDWVNPEQVEWLQADLRATQLPTVVFTHQCVAPFWAKDAHVNRAAVRQGLAAANRQAGWQKVIACFSGHHHTDYLVKEEGIHYLWVNSASYYWVGEEYGSLAKYRDPLFTFVTLDAGGAVRIEGRSSEFLPPTPRERNHPDASFVTASILERRLTFLPRTAAR